MNESLPPFSGDDPRCPKCGSEGATTRWLAAGQDEFGVTHWGTRNSERLRRDCTRCGYGWDEAIVSAPASTLRAQVLD